MEDDISSGYGEFDFANGACYIGNWTLKDSIQVREGFGKFIYPPILIPPTPTTRILPGKENSSSRHSSRSMASSGKEPEEEKMSKPTTFQEEYEGEWLNDRMHGYGVYKYASGAVYEGEWQEGTHHGHGTYFFPNGSLYVGYWENHRMTGKGVFTDTNQKQWEGIFINGTYDSSIQKSLKAEFERAELVKSLEKVGGQAITAMKQAFQGDKRTWKEAFIKHLVTNMEEVDKFIGEPYCRLDDRHIDKWNDIITQLGDVTPIPLKKREEATLIPSERVFSSQLSGVGQILEFSKKTEERSIELCMVQGESGAWRVFHCADVKI